MTKRSAPADALNFRAFQVRAKSINAEKRSIEAFVTTETPVNEWDWMRGEMVPRVLLTSGAQLPKNKQVPLLDAHSRWSVTTQLGSGRNLAKEENGVTASLEFSSTAEDEWTKVREGHVTDVSAGFEVLEEVYIPLGESRSFGGKQFNGPVNVARKWRLREVSLVPIGADEAAKMRGYRVDSGKLVPEKPVPPAVGSFTKEEFRMNAELRKLCVERGMDEKLSDVDAQAWLVANAATVMAQPAANRGADAGGPAVPPVEVKNTGPTAEDIARAVDKAFELRQKAEKDQRDAFERDCNATLELVFGTSEAVPAEVRSAALGCRTIDEARAAIKAAKAKHDEATRISGHFGGVTAGESQREKHREALQTAMSVRTLELRGYGMAEKFLPAATRAKGWDQFSNARLIDFARECLMADGYRYEELRSLSGEQLAKAAMGWPEKQGLRHPGELLGHRGYAYHTTGSLAYITLDAMNKTVSNAYAEFPSTWRGPMRQAASVPDFKNKHVVKFSAAGNLPIWQDNKAPHEAAFANEKETYAIEARAETAKFSWQLYVNDDQDTLSRVPGMLSAAAARTVNAVAWSQVTGNPTLADGKALFLETPAGNRKRKNLTTGAGAPSVATLQTLTNLMMQMRGLNTPEGNESQDILNLQPAYLPHPSALRTTVLQLIRSSADPAASGNSGIYNPAQGLIPVTEPLLDATSTTAWYLFCSPTQHDTVEVTFLQGQETPVIESYVDEATWCRNLTIVQCFAAKAIDHRGVQQHAGQ